jgi:hypothetical protein
LRDARVTGSRLEAVRYKQSFDRYIQEKGYAIKTLMAFSGTVQDDKLADVDCRVGLAPTGKRRLVTAHTQRGHRTPQVSDRRPRHVALLGRATSG